MSGASEASNMFTVNKTEMIYKDPWLALRKDYITRYDGFQQEFAVVLQNNGVHVLPVDDKGNTWLVEQHRYSTGWSLEAVAGSIEEGETPEVSASKELLEETGLQAKHLIPLGTYKPGTDNFEGHAHFFLAQGITETGQQQLEKAEATLKVIKMPLSEAVEKAMRGDIILCSSVGVILKAARYLGV